MKKCCLICFINMALCYQCLNVDERLKQRIVIDLLMKQSCWVVDIHTWLNDWGIRTWCHLCVALAKEVQTKRNWNYGWLRSCWPICVISGVFFFFPETLLLLCFILSFVFGRVYQALQHDVYPWWLHGGTETAFWYSLTCCLGGGYFYF